MNLVKIVKILIIALLIAGIAGLVYRLVTLRQVQISSSNGQVEQLIANQPITLEIGELKVTEGVKHIVPLEEVVEGGVTRSDIQAIKEPKFQSIKDVGAYLTADSRGLVLSYQGITRFYPFQILLWHEIVNDKIFDLPLAVTYSPLSGAANVFIRSLDSEEIPLAVSDKLFNNNTLMADQLYGNLISQLTGQVLVGERAGKDLKVYPSDVITWKDFRKNFPDGQVLSTETGFDRDYTFDPYGDYYFTHNIFYPLTVLDQRFHPKESLHGLVINGKPKAYIDSKVRNERLINDEIGGLPVVTWVDPFTQAIRIFERRAGEIELSFEVSNGRLFDHQTNSTWDFNGQAIDGRLKGSRLNILPDVTSYWFVWYAHNPTTIVWGL